MQKRPDSGESNNNDLRLLTNLTICSAIIVLWFDIRLKFWLNITNSPVSRRLFSMSCLWASEFFRGWAWRSGGQSDARKRARW